METGRSPMRILAPLALVVFGIALLLVVVTSGGSGEESSSSTKAAEEARDLGGKSDTTDTTERDAKEEEPADAQDLPKKYTVKEGDTLGGIAESTGVPVERLQELNPGLDQFSLVQGQKINLR